MQCVEAATALDRTLMGSSANDLAKRAADHRIAEFDRAVFEIYGLSQEDVALVRSTDAGAEPIDESAA
jgi:hypothetical protein